MSIPWLYNNWYGLHKLNRILLKLKCTPALWFSYHYLSTCLLHALLHTIDEPNNIKLLHLMKSALQFFKKILNPNFLKYQALIFLLILMPLGKLIKHALLLKSIIFWQGLWQKYNVIFHFLYKWVMYNVHVCSSYSWL